MAILTNDEVAKAVFSKNLWTQVDESLRLVAEPIINQVAAGIEEFLGSASHAARIETYVDSTITPAVTTVDYEVYRPGSTHIYVRTTPMDYLSVQIFEGEDRIELTRDTHFYANNLNIVDDDGTERHISRSGKLTKRGYVSWRFPVEVRYHGGFSATVAPQAWKMIQMAMTVSIRDQFISQRRSVGLKGAMLPGIIKRENIGDYEYEIDAKASTLGGASGIGSVYGLSPAAVAILWPLKNSARFI